MAKIIQFNDNKYFNIDEQMLYIDGKELGSPLEGIPFRILKYLATNSPNLMSQEQIRENCWNENLGEGSVPFHVMKLRKAIRDEKIPGKRQYVYIVERDGKYKCSCSITDNSTHKNKNNSNHITLPYDSKQFKNKLCDFLNSAHLIQNGLLNAVLYCNCKWGTCTFDTEFQYANTCEGLLALISSDEHKNHTEILEDCLLQLFNSIKENGLPSKSLGVATVVPTSMYIYISSFIKEMIDKNTIIHLTKKIYEVRESSGWGIYVKKMGNNTNIGCTYWALIGLLSNNIIDSNLVQKSIVSLFKYNGAYSFGRTIGEVNPKIPYLYSTSMMYILYSHLSTNNKELIKNKFDHKKSLDVIVKHFDNPFFLLEEEGIHGIETAKQTNVHTATWNHITIHYSLKALSMAMLNNHLSEQEIIDILRRIILLFQDNCQNNDGKFYWTDPKTSIEKGYRGKLIFPTMHAIMGLVAIIDSINIILENNTKGGEH